MAEHAENVEFWKGFVAGTLFGLVAAAYARGDFRRLLSVTTNCKPSPLEPAHTFREHAEELKLRRESSENAGDPTRLSPAISSGPTLQVMPIERPAGAPGPASDHEILEVPGRHGELIDHSDAAAQVRSAARTHKLPPAGI